MPDTPLGGRSYENPHVADERTEAQRGEATCPQSHSRERESRLEPSLTWRAGGGATSSAAADQVLSREINSVKQGIRENINNPRQRNELL